MDPFGELCVDLSPSELRETAYEILVGACRSSGSGRRLTFVSSSNSRERSQQQSLTQKSAASKIKNGLGLKPKKMNVVGVCGAGGEEDESGDPYRKRGGGFTLGELMRVQMRISEQTDSRVRRGYLRVAAGQLGRCIESMVLPLELLQHLRSSDFTTEREYEAWQRRNLKVLEAGLLVHPHFPLDKSLTAPQRLRQILHAASQKPIDAGKHSESMRVLSNLVSSLAFRSTDGSASDICHWADGIPLNLHLYKILIESCFDLNDGTSVVEEVDDVLDQVKKTWLILGIDQLFHNLCFFWVLFHQYVVTGETENNLIFAVDHLILELVEDAKRPKTIHASIYMKMLSSTLRLVLDWAEKKLSQYHEFFYRVNIDVMKSVVSLGVTAASTLVDIAHEYGKQRKEVDVACSRVDAYIRSSVRSTFSQEREKLIATKKSSKNQQSPLPLLCILAQNISDMAFNEKEIYSPILKRWHPYATGVAVATLHACYAKELQQFVSSIRELNPEAIQVLLAAEKLEKDLVEMAVADSLDSEDGGKATIQEMVPYETQTVIANLVKSWIETRLDRLREWVDRNSQREDWNPQVNKGRFAPSSVEVLRIVDETLEAFFLLPIPMHPVLLPELIGGIDKCLQNYIIKAKSGCGSRVSFIPPLPALTRCATGSKLRAFKRKDRSLLGPGRKSQVYNRDRDDIFSVPHQCLRINTLYNIRKELESLERRVISNLKSSGLAHEEYSGNGNFSLSKASSVAGIQELSEAVAYKVVFHDLSYVLSEYLYLGEVSSSRIEPFLEELEQNLEIISVTVHDRVRTRVIIDVMKACFEGFLLVLLAGGPSRVFSVQDAEIINEDFKLLNDLFWSNGDGLPADVIDKVSAGVKGVLSLFQTGTDNLVEQFRHVASLGNDHVSARRKPPSLPQTTGQWSETDPNTILRVLCHRNDKLASKFLKKTYDLPKKT